MNNYTRTFHSDGTMFIDKYLLLRDELTILSKLQAFTGNPLCGAVCTNCFEKCAYFFANITIRMIQEMHQRLRKTVFRFETMDPERREGRGQWHHRGGGGSRERNEGRGRVGGGEGEGVRRGRGGGGGRGEGERGRARARRQTVSYILVDACQGWIRHARGFSPRCLSRANIACDVEEVLWPVSDQRRNAGAE